MPFDGPALERLYALYNRAVWPAHGLAALLSLGLIAAALRAREPRTALLLLAFAWALPALIFVRPWIGQLVWAAPWFATGMLAQAALLVLSAFGPWRLRWRAHGPARLAGLGLLCVAVLVFPWLGATLSSRSWDAVEVFGLVPAPAALATAALITMTRGWMRIALLPALLGWAVLAGALAWTLELAHAWVGLALVGLALALAISRHDSRSTA